MSQILNPSSGGGGGSGIQTINTIGPDGAGNFDVTSNDASVIITPGTNSIDLSVPSAATPVILSVVMTTDTPIPQNTLSPFLYDTILVDSASGYNMATGMYTFPLSGVYQISLTSNILSTAGFINCDVFVMDGINFTFHGSSTATVSDPNASIMCASFIAPFNSGDTTGLSLFSQTVGATPLTVEGFGNGYSNTFCIEKIS